jgi:mono-ADP-ribosyltransferase sirtuin 6
LEKKERKTTVQKKENRKRKHESIQDKKLESSDKRHIKNNTLNEKILKIDSDCTSMDFAKAQPTLTHKALTRLAIDGKLKYLITQNVDGLHRRAGLMRNVHCSLHGCAFTEKCQNSDCQAEFFRDFDVGGMSFQPTGRRCTLCGEKLLDTLLDWEDALPEADFERAEAECDKADLVICLGTSLRIEPVGSLPLRARKFIIVNLQVTPKDEHAALIIKAPVDLVMEHLMSYLGFDDNWKYTAAPVERVWTSP